MNLSKNKCIFLSVLSFLIALVLCGIIIYDMFLPLGDGVREDETLRIRYIVLSAVGFLVFMSSAVFFLSKAFDDEKRKKKTKFVLAIIFGILAALCSFTVLSVFVIPGVTIRIRTFFLAIVGAVYFMIYTLALFSEAIDSIKVKKTIVKIAVLFSFVVYIIAFLGFLLLFKSYTNEGILRFSYNKNWLSDVLPNLVPFKTTVVKIMGIVSGDRAVLKTVFDFFANAFAYVPLSFFLPAIFKTMRRFDSFLPMIVFITVATEIFQGMFGVGSCKIDDFIFGAGFACLAFYLLRRPAVIRYFDEKHIYF